MTGVAAGAIRSTLSCLGDDPSRAARVQVSTRIAGSRWVPRSLARGIFRAGGLDVASAPGVGFVFVGPACNPRVGAGVYLNQRVFIETTAPVSIGVLRHRNGGDDLDEPSHD